MREEARGIMQGKSIALISELVKELGHIDDALVPPLIKGFALVG